MRGSRESTWAAWRLNVSSTPAFSSVCKEASWNGTSLSLAPWAAAQSEMK
eukprot:CAMPEP_0194783148 /NCGR_PEP_ID=MMETSP0323_2-20130528/79067_1 /TAXON_ID=2866 ORGANISM="Crypthecodinium cohnii, Strain Seligo" /NCGR_SAMPLE_ID=MMETSP0323_2 /ASSEMBLY_ACC=CAM_ASM_000346 /LENGTH=49 /DNA_ID=CAMNT_0039722005 /DNA_START=787 /DNA_END=936 /DNA_ORIENTATION=+